MSINIQARGFPLTRALENAVRTNFVDMLDAYQNVSLLDVRLEDINSSHHGGIDKRCQVVLKLTVNTPCLCALPRMTCIWRSSIVPPG